MINIEKLKCCDIKAVERLAKSLGLKITEEHKRYYDFEYFDFLIFAVMRALKEDAEKASREQSRDNFKNGKGGFYRIKDSRASSS